MADVVEGGKHYRVKVMKDEGFGTFNVYCDGDWLETVHTQEEADTIIADRRKFDAMHRLLRG